MMKFLGRRYRLILPIWALLLGGLLVFQYAPSMKSSPAHAQSSRYRLSRLYYLSRVIFLINKHYVDQLQITPQKMFRQSLEMIQSTVPSVMVRFAKDGKSVTVAVDKASKTFKLQAFPLIFSVPYQLRSIFSFIEANYKGDVGQRKIEFAAIHGMLKSLDPHTSFLPPSFYQDMQMHTRGSFGGLGIVIQSRKGYLTVVTPMPDTPAARVGLKALDRIVRIGDESTINMSLNEAVNKLRGAPGSKVEIWVQRKGFSQPKRFVITRAIINVKSVSSNLLPSKVGYIRIKNFQQDTAPDIRRALLSFHKSSKNRLRGLILDLRDNPGGLLSQAIKVSDLFLDRGVIVTHAGGLSRREVHRAHAFGTEPKYPIIVLVNRGSASASEIVAGALKNHNRAIILGQRTYGKGTVQVLYPIMPPRYAMRERSALKLTVAQYLTPGDISIQKIGIAPDIRLRVTNISKDSVHFFGSDERKLEKKKLPRYLKGVAEGRSELYSLSYLDERSDKERAESYREDYKKNEKLKMDFEMKLAQKLILSTKKWHRPRMFKALEKKLNQVRDEQAKLIHKALKKAGVVWDNSSKGETGKPKLSFSYKILPPKKRKKGERAPRGNRVYAGSSFRIQVKVRNRGKRTAYRVRAMSSSNYWFLHRKEFVFGKLRPKQSKRWTVNVKLPLWLKTQYHSLAITVRSHNKDFKLKKSIKLRIMGAKRPRYDFSYALEEIRGNGDGLIQPGERFALRVTVRNSGAGKSYQTIGMLKNKTGRELFIERGRIQFGPLQPKQLSTGWFYLRIHPYTQRKTIKMQVSLFDAELHTNVRRQLVLPVAPTGLRKQKLKSWVKVKEESAWLYSGADFGTPRVGRVSKGARLKVMAQLGSFFQVKLSSKQWGKIPPKKARRHNPTWYAWVAARDVDKKAKGTRRYKPKYKLYWQAVTPQIVVRTSRFPKTTRSEKFVLKGTVRNNVSLLDTYILVNGNKVYYRALRNIPKLTFSLPIKLKKGTNRIQIVARENTQFAGLKELFIYRRK
ncbi:MAG: PDZ domain-containing protein [Deltaproteobacteria bacterium]|nr:MAG: PDZ domain-containing protein [Deltaproteobacteria bacterium]